MRPLRPFPWEAVNEMLESGIEDVGARRLARAQTKEALKGFNMEQRRRFLAVECSALKELRLRLQKKLR